MSHEEPAQSRVVIHIGWHKSASTFLQDGFFQKLGANYQPLDAFPADFTRPAGMNGLIDLVEAKSDFDAAMLRELTLPPASSNDTLTIISHEEISGHPHGYSLIDPFSSASNLAAAYPGAKIVAITRNQIDYILSLYSYRVAVRGHESRSLARFVEEEIEAGLLEHLQYDRLISEYIRLFGAENILVLPMEMIRSKPEQFFGRLTKFMNCTPESTPTTKAENESTRQAFTLALWRPANAIFSAILKFMLIFRGENPSNFSPEKQKVYPFLRFRYRYYAFKRRWTRKLNRLIRNSRRIGQEDIPDQNGLRLKFAASNTRLFDLGILDWNLEEYGYAGKHGIVTPEDQTFE